MLTKDKLKNSLEGIQRASSSAISLMALQAKKQTKYLIRPPKNLVTNPKIRRIFSVALVLVFIYLLIALIPIKRAYQLNFQNSWFLSLAEKIVPYPMATVGKKVILLSRLKSDIILVKNFIEKSKTADRYQGNSIERILYDRLIEVSLVENIAKEYHINVTDTEADKAWNEILVEEEGFGDVKQILKELYGIEEGQIKRYIAETILREKVEELPQRRRVRHILIVFDKNNQADKDKSLAKIQEVQKIVQTGTKFEDVAREHSQDVKSRDSGGDLGWVDTAFQLEGQDEPNLRKAIFSTPINQMSEPAESHLGYHLVMPIEEKGSVEKSMKQMIDEARLKVKVIKFIKL